MKILDTQTGDIHEYGADGHDSLRVSQSGRFLSYYNLQNGDGSAYGDYRFVCDDNKVPSESETADARHAHVFFNIGGWHKRPQGDCENCDFRKFSETFIDGVVDLMNKNGITSVEQLSELLKGGAGNEQLD